MATSSFVKLQQDLLLKLWTAQSQILDTLLTLFPHRNREHLCGKCILWLDGKALVVVEDGLLELTLHIRCMCYVEKREDGSRSAGLRKCFNLMVKMALEQV